MIQITPQMKIYLVYDPVDFRKGIDGLRAVCRQKLEVNPFSGSLFLFRNRSKTTLKILVYDGQGFWLFTKRLSKGKFQWWPKVNSGNEVLELDARELQIFLWNGDPSSAEFSEFWKKI